MARPLFIVLEGIDGSGSTTQSKLLYERIGGEGRAVLTREPGGTPIAEKIRALVLDPQHTSIHARAELFLYAACRAQHVYERIIPALEAGKAVVCDRFTASTLAYQGYGREQDLGFIGQVAALAEEGIQPDLTFVLDLPIEVAQQRRHMRAGLPDRLEAEELSFHQRVATGYREIAAQQPQKYQMLDATAPIADIAQDIERILTERWPNFPLTG